MNAVEIVVAFVVALDGSILVQLRRGDAGLAGTWELPGGKVASGETHAEALAREVLEETGLEVAVGPLVCALCHEYADRRVALHAYVCRSLGEAAPPATTRWVTLEACRALPIPAANPPLLTELAWLLRLAR